MTSSGDGGPDLEPVTYGQLLNDIKARMQSARVGAALAVNRALIELYWQIGSEILEREHEQGWGASGWRLICAASSRT